MYREWFLIARLTLIAGLVLLIQSCEDIIEKDISESEITIISPKSGLESESSNVGFYWEVVDGATGYQLQVVTQSFEEIRAFIVDTVQQDNYYEAQLSKGTYQWRIKALNNGYETAYSEIRDIIIVDNDDLGNDVLSLLEPAQGKYFQNGTLEFRWTELPKAQQYVFELVDYPEFRDTITSSFTSVEFDMADGKYAWRVKALNDVSLITSTAREINFDNTPPLVSTFQLQNKDTLLIDDQLSWIRNSSDVIKDVVLVAFDDEFTNIVDSFPQEVGAGNSINIDEGIFDRNTTYFIKVVSYDRANNESELETVLEFYID